MMRRHITKRTKQEIASDIAFVLGMPLHSRTKYVVLKNAASAWTQFDGKISGCRYWSVPAKLLFANTLKRQYDALQTALASPLNPKADLKTLRKFKCVHEHVVPKDVFCRILMALENPTVDTVYELCDKLLVAAIVTQDEDGQLTKAKLRQVMPPEFHEVGHTLYRNPWLRYAACGVKLLPSPPDWPTGYPA